MSVKWEIIFYETEKGDCPVRNFIEKKKEKNQAKIITAIQYLGKTGPNLPRPYADLLENGIYELRIKIAEDDGGTQTRILYFFYDRTDIILTHGFMKTTDEVPEKEIAKAKKYRDDYISRKK
ncbi:MAG: hypothetical protein A2068_12930 [Ignavibacteria bacterium GWB2_35_6b]|nr:MAG: hypothetical protein A2068_12930 [Ignavibacteria bacterium GWB2_35_6b]